MTCLDESRIIAIVRRATEVTVEERTIPLDTCCVGFTGPFGIAWQRTEKEPVVCMRRGPEWSWGGLGGVCTLGHDDPGPPCTSIASSRAWGLNG